MFHVHFNTELAQVTPSLLLSIFFPKNAGIEDVDTRYLWCGLAFTGAIDACELMTAFNVLGMHVKKSEVEAMLSEVDADGSGEVGDSFFPPFQRFKVDFTFYSTCATLQKQNCLHTLPFVHSLMFSYLLCAGDIWNLRSL